METRPVTKAPKAKGVVVQGPMTMPAHTEVPFLALNSRVGLKGVPAKGPGSLRNLRRRIDTLLKRMEAHNGAAARYSNGPVSTPVLAQVCTPGEVKMVKCENGTRTEVCVCTCNPEGTGWNCEPA